MCQRPVSRSRHCVAVRNYPYRRSRYPTRYGQKGYGKTGVVDDAVHPLVHEAHEGAQLSLDAIPASIVRRDRGDSTSLTQPSLADVSRVPKCHNNSLI